jgi:glycosyltransferase involved in cell wall biosynthesis
MKERVNFYFFAGDFADAIRRYREGQEQVYATHNEVARLLLDLAKAGFDVNVFSFITSVKDTITPAEGLVIKQLGARKYNDPHAVQAFREHPADISVLHMPDPKLLQLGTESSGRGFPIFANSYNRIGLRPTIERRRVAKILNHPKYRFVSNHCPPATEHLADLGVDRCKLIAWNVPISSSPLMHATKTLKSGGRISLGFAGSISEDKGVGDLIKAVSILSRQGFEVDCRLAGRGDLEKYRSLASKCGIGERVQFLGLVPNDDVRTLFRDVGMVIVPSRRIYTEGFPLVLLEAIASRTPIICSDHPMFRRVMRNGETAAVFKESNARQLAAQVRALASDADLYARLSEAALISWAELAATADWRTMIFDWVTQGDSSPYLQAHTLEALKARVPLA